MAGRAVLLAGPPGTGKVLIFFHFSNLPKRMILMFKPNWIRVLTSLCLAKLVICMFEKLMCSNTIEYLKSVLLKFKLSWLTSKEERMKSLEGPPLCLEFVLYLFLVSFALEINFCWPRTSLNLGDDILLEGERKSVSDHFFEGCVRNGEKRKKKGIRCFLSLRDFQCPGQREETMRAQNTSVDH